MTKVWRDMMLFFVIAAVTTDAQTTLETETRATATWNPSSIKPMTDGSASNDGGSDMALPTRNASEPRPNMTDAPQNTTEAMDVGSSSSSSSSTGWNGSIAGSMAADEVTFDTLAPTPLPIEIGKVETNALYGVIIVIVVAAAIVILALLYVIRRLKRQARRQRTESRDLNVTKDADASAVSLSPETLAVANVEDPQHNDNTPSPSATARTYLALAPTPVAASNSTLSTASTASTDELSAIWRDPGILAHRVPFHLVQKRDVLSRGGFGEVFDGLYGDRRVAIKCLLPENRKLMACLEDFLREVLLFSSLEHPRIVTFIGVAWEAPRDLCILLEFMTKGDLRHVLTKWREDGRKTGWDKTKLQIACHVAEGLTYLHTLPRKIVHRDLKSKNVLIDDAWHAKLSDFGISREESSRNTMTSNVGSSLWIAPEVMMGENYDDKADIFSFGIVLTELDTHQLPYHSITTPDGRKVPDAALLHMVTMGKIQAEFSAMSRTDVVLLGRACLALDPAKRPSAPELRHRLQQILQSMK